MEPTILLPSMRRLAFAIVASCCVSLSSAAAEERILDFQSRITVRPDAALDVRETIRVSCEGQEIKRGIYRDFPTDYRDRSGLMVRVGFRVREVLRDGQPEPFHSERRSNGVRLYIGQSDVYLSPGEYTYTLVYATDGQVGFFPLHDELYWNVTGNEWAFPILRASAVVELPPGVAEGIGEVDAYTGPAGARGKNFASRRNPDGTVSFASTRTLAPGEGLTILVSWRKGLIREPTRAEKAKALIEDNPGPAGGLLAIFLLVVYYLVVWFRVGRDPAAGTIIPLYSPPGGLSPAAVRFIRRMGFDPKAMAAAVIDLAVKGHLTIREKNGVWTLARRAEAAASASPDEEAVRKALLEEDETVQLKQSNHRVVQSALQAIQSSLRLSYEKVYFVTNAGYFAGGLVASILILVLNLVLQSAGVESIFLGVWLSLWTIGVVFLLKQVFLAWGALLSGRSGRFAGPAGALFWTLFALPFVGAEVVVGGVFFLKGSPLVLLAILAVAGVNLVFHQLLKAPTRAGRKILDGIEGFRLFLSVSERDWLELAGPPERTPGLYERFLPYALALDVEQRWAEKFSGVLKRAGEGSSYHPSWYSGAAWTGANVASFPSTLSSSLAGAIAASSSSPGSSSGGGGGGSSGGGGGGGGGGGW